MPKVSVIVPNYNHARFLNQRLQSVLNQTYQDFELIYLDDASTDDSNEVFAPYANFPRVRAIFNQTNSGSPFKQWNKGIQAATGEYIWIAESDDYADPRFLENLVKVLDHQLQVGLVYCDSWTSDADGNISDGLHGWIDDLNTNRWKHDFLNNGLKECQNYLAHKNTIPNASAVLVRRSLFEQVGYAEESMFLCGDWMTWIKILLQSDIAFIASKLNYYRCHSHSARSSSQQWRNLYERMQIFAFLAQQIELDPAAANLIWQKLLQDWAALNLSRSISIQQNLSLYQLGKSCKLSLELPLMQHLIARATDRAIQKIHR